MTATVIEFETTGPAADERLIREYLLSATERLTDTDACEAAGFLRYGHDPGRPGGAVKLHLCGETDLLVAAERDRWDELVESGLARSWTDAGPDDDTETFGERGDRLVADLTFLATEMARPLYEAYDDFDALAPADSYPEEDAIPAGWWTLCHFLANHRGLTAREEIDVNIEAIRSRLRSLGARDPVAAEQTLGTLRGELDSIQREIEATKDELPE